MPADLAPPPPPPGEPAPAPLYLASPPPQHTSTMPSEAPTVRTVRPDVAVVSAPPRRASRGWLWAAAAGVAGFAIGIAAQAPLGFGDRGRGPAAATPRLGTTEVELGVEGPRGAPDGVAAAEAGEAALGDDLALEEDLASEEEADLADPALADEESAREAEEAVGDEPSAAAPVTDDASPQAARGDAAAPAPVVRSDAQPDAAATAPQGAATRPQRSVTAAGSDPYAPVEPPPPGTAPSAGGGGFDRAVAASALGGATSAASACGGADAPSGVARVAITFAPSGRVTQATVSGPPYAGTATGSCIARAFRSATVPPFDGAPVTVTKTVTIR